MYLDDSHLPAGHSPVQNRTGYLEILVRFHTELAEDREKILDTPAGEPGGVRHDRQTRQQHGKCRHDGVEDSCDSESDTDDVIEECPEQILPNDAICFLRERENINDFR
jgi:hypothetical protein